MKLYKIIGFILAIIIMLFVLFVTCSNNNPDSNYKNIDMSNTDTTLSKSSDSLKAQDLSTKDIKKYMKSTDDRVKKVKKKIHYEYNNDHYDGDILIYRYFECGVESESYAGYNLYYNEHGKLTYAEVGHYRGAFYSIYFYNDELLHVKVGPFTSGSKIFINGDMENVVDVIKKDSDYAFVLDDISLCLEHAYE